MERGPARPNLSTQEMMALAKREAGKTGLEGGNVAADEMVEDALLRAELLLHEHNVEVSIAPDLPGLRVDPRLISQVLFTLIENAAKYSGAGTKIVISARSHPDHAVRFAVCDDGPGIAPELRAQVFQKFFRAGSQPGFGMGLAIARGIVQAHGGKIWIEDGRNKKGATVQFQVPVGDQR